MANELEHGLRSLAEVQAGLERFRAGAGRHGVVRLGPSPVGQLARPPGQLAGMVVR